MTIGIFCSQNTDGARIWADFIQAYGINASDEENLTILQLAVQQYDITGSDGLVKMYFKYNGAENDEAVETAWNTLTTYLKQSEYKERYANIIRYAYRACLEDFTYEYFSQGRESKIFEKSLAFIDFLLSNGYSATDKDGYSPDTFVEKFLWRTENEGVPFAEQLKATFAKHGITVN